MASYPENHHTKIRFSADYTNYQDTEVDVAYVLITQKCPVGCSFCVVDASMTAEMQTMSDTTLSAVATFLRSANLKNLIISGGDPIVCLDKTLALMNIVNAEHVEVITSGFWAETEEKALNIIAKLTKNRGNTYYPLRLRVSIDNWHLEHNKVTLQHYKNIINACAKSNSSAIELYFRSVIEDKTVEDLAAYGGYEIEDIDFPFRRCLVVQNRKIDIQYKNMKLVTRDGHLLKTKNIGTLYPVESYISRMTDEQGKFSPGFSYDFIKTEMLTGINLEITTNGDVLIFASTPPDNIVNVLTHTFSNAKKQWFSDYILRAILEKGIHFVLNLAAEHEPDLMDQCLSTNDFSQYARICLNTPALREYVMMRILQMGTGIIE